ncbi:MAG: amidohydrolase family protein [Bacteroidetes bacterium]|nr:amidohydrolase family protein [Bacteroidota bacterium]
MLIANCILPCTAQVPVPAQPHKGSILLLNGIAHIGTGKVIENSAIALKDGKIELVGDAATMRMDLRMFDTVLRIPGKHIYPGFIVPNVTLGLVEIEAVRATRDFNETGTINPAVRSIIAYNAESQIIPTVRSNGVLLAQITPRGGLISGASSIVELDAWNWEDAAYKTDDGIHLNWPRTPRKNPDDDEEDDEKKKKKQDPSEAVKQKTSLKQFFEKAKAYSQISSPPEKDLNLEAMRGLFDGTKTLFIHTDYVKDIMESITFAKSFGIPRIVLSGGYDSYMITGFLKSENIPVMLRRVHELPMRQDEDANLPYRLPYLLQKAGILFCLQNEGDQEATQTRNLAFYAGTAVAYGLSKEEALAAITLNTAKILGIDKTVGSIETGKDATLIVSSGDALDMKSNNIELAFIRGKQIDLNNFQKELYEKYKAKHEREGIMKK